MICTVCKQPVPASQITVMYSDENRTALQANCACHIITGSHALITPTSYVVINQRRWMEEPEDDNLTPQE